MAAPEPDEKHLFIEGIGGRLGAQKSDAYAKAVLAVEGRNNQYTARYMLASDLAYVLTAMELGITPEKEGKALVRCLLDMIPKAEELGRTHTAGDIVLQREFWIADVVGKDAAYWIHIGRNRGESMRGFLPRMFFRDTLYREHIALMKLVRALVDRAGPTLESVIPFYHHMQHAGRTTLGEYLLSWATKFHEHFVRLADADRNLDIAPPPNCGREIVVELINRTGKRLGFSEVAQLWQWMNITEEHFSEPFFVLVQIIVQVARLAEDLRIWMTSEFNFFELADEHASISSGRPQKKNPFGLQAIIGGAGVGVGRLAGQMAINISLSEEADTTYHATGLYQYANDVVTWTEFMAEIIAKGDFKLDEMAKKSTHGYAGAREALDVLVYEHHVPYRYAHHVLGGLVREASSGTDHAGMAAYLRANLTDYPKVDCDELVRTSLAETDTNIMLNLKAYRESHQFLDRSLREMKPVNPSEIAIERLMDEGRRVIG